MTTPVEITVRGTASRRVPAELGSLIISAEIRGGDRADVTARASAVHRSIVQSLSDLSERGSLRDWADVGVRIVAERPWRHDGSRGDVEQVCSLWSRAEFSDVEALAGFIDAHGLDERLQLSEITWDLTPETRATVEAEVQIEAVRDARLRATAYAAAVDAGPLRLARLADPGLLGSSGGQDAHYARMVHPAAASGGFELRAADIEVQCQVDARFLAG